MTNALALPPNEEKADKLVVGRSRSIADTLAQLRLPMLASSESSTEVRSIDQVWLRHGRPGTKGAALLTAKTDLIIRKVEPWATAAPIDWAFSSRRPTPRCDRALPKAQHLLALREVL